MANDQRECVSEEIKKMKTRKNAQQSNCFVIVGERVQNAFDVMHLFKLHFVSVISFERTKQKSQAPNDYIRVTIIVVYYDSCLFFYSCALG